MTVPIGTSECYKIAFNNLGGTTRRTNIQREILYIMCIHSVNVYMYIHWILLWVGCGLGVRHRSKHRANWSGDS